MKKEIKLGAVLSYLLLFFNMLYALFFTPFILEFVGEEAYGVYKTVASMSASLAIMDLGLGSTMIRYIAKFSATGEKKEAENFSAMILIQFLAIAGIIAVIGIYMFFSADKLFSKTFSEASIRLSKVLLLIMISSLVVSLLENLLFGIISGYQHFFYSNCVKLVGLLLKSFFTVILLLIWNNILVVVLMDLVMNLLIVVAYIVYIRFKLKLNIKLYYWNKALFKESFGYTVLMFIQSITMQLNGNVDSFFIGIEIGARSVTIYSMALQVFNMYENLSGALANLMLPILAKKIEDGEKREELQETVENVGRLQFAILGMVLGGIVVLGSDFYQLWLGRDFSDCYILTLILVIPVTFPMVQNTMLSILRAENRMIYRTVTLAISCVCNILVTYEGIKLCGYWGAAIGTAFSTVLNLILMNIYYNRILGFDIKRLWIRIMKRILPCFLTSTLIAYIIHLFFYGTWIKFIIDAFIFLVLYLTSLYFYGFYNADEYSCAVTPQVRQTGNRLSGLTETAYASLLA